MKIFSQTMSELRKERGISQRKAAADLKISQALLSHYENDAREPGLDFVCRACRYYGVSADYLLGLADESARTASREEFESLVEELRALSEKAGKKLEELKK
ncbi:MAG: helix-turn-helix transcriptional regulator [Ruminococcaceae bacterium]|nr:helix-turn-helix transcriptional regulator [Oscillospiraceae bacterium]